MSVLLLSAALAFAAPAYSDLSPDQAARTAESRYGGQVLDIQSVRTGDGKGYRIKLLQPSGRVKLLVIDASDGASQNFRDNDDNGGKGRGRGRGRGRGGDD
ncbi:PepSY domain-containing protein [Motiliproteus sediminis]|uniref:PepSY domain-containing protein n=1 Tax=Motiliproteus sediminis TaxID=1468178 RepID=UPI001AEF5F6A|nr:PepSY domain-containing protein [Motiliproteus sediminis]